METSPGSFFTVFLRAVVTSVAPSVEVEPIPEPGTTLLLAAGLLATALGRRNRSGV